MSIRFMTTAKVATYPAIPLDAGQVQGWKDLPIKEDGRFDPLVPLGLFTGEVGILTSSIYFGEHTNSPYADDAHTLEGSLLTLFARQSVARRLIAAERLLPAGHHLLVFDAYRPYQVQKSLHDFYKQKLKEKYPDMDNEALEVETQKYVSVPSKDPARPSPHNTGGAIDLAIVKLNRMHEKELQQIRSYLADNTLSGAKRLGMEMQLSAIMRHHGKMLNFGTAFDHGGEKSALTYYESKIAVAENLTDADRQACTNRRLLWWVMTQAGFQPYFAEWWHFNAPESQMGAAAAGLDHATFGAADFTASNRAHENIRLMVRQDVIRLRKEGDLSTVNNWPAEIIAPAEVPAEE
jgi:D-alanyl-D-alanine dipeptidase